MRIRLYSLKDRLLGAFLAPFPARADVEAVRQLKNSLKDPQMAQSQLVQHKEDYDLYYVGIFDDETGEFFSEAGAGSKVPVLLINVAKLEVEHAPQMVAYNPVQS